MEQFLNVLGFTNLTGVCWNILAYIGMVMIIVAVVSVKLRNQLFVWGPLLLLLYAGFYLHNPILAALQLIIVTSGIQNLFHTSKNLYVIIALAIIAYITLLLTGQIYGIWPWMGSFGLLGIALGLTQLPKKRGFALMAAGGALIVIYAFALQIWVFFVLNAIFSVANLLELRKK